MQNFATQIKTSKNKAKVWHNLYHCRYISGYAIGSLKRQRHRAGPNTLCDVNTHPELIMSRFQMGILRSTGLFPYVRTCAKNAQVESAGNSPS